MSKIVVGDYATAQDAMNRINDLVAQGYPKDSISVIAGKEDASYLKGTGVTVERDFEYVEGVSDESLWDRIKTFFGFENSKLYETSIAAYRNSILDGDVLVLVDDSYLSQDQINVLNGTVTYNDTAKVDAYAGKHAGTLYDNMDEDEVVRLRAERMNVDKETVKAGEAIIHKRVVEEMKTVEVPVMHEEIVIERRAIADEDATGASFEDETISIPVMEEQVIVSKHPVVTEEVLVHKRDIENTQQVSATLRREKLDVEQVGDTIILDDNSPSARQKS